MLSLSLPFLTGVSLIGGCATEKSPAPAAPATAQYASIIDIAPKEAFALIRDNKNSPDFIILDVRTPEELASGHIENAVNIDFTAPDFRQQISKLDRQKTYLVYCQSGVRSLNAAKTMMELGFKQIYNMLDGISGWQAAGLPLVK